MKTSNLIGPALDWAVAKCEGLDAYRSEAWIDNVLTLVVYVANRGMFLPSTDWSQGGPIIERMFSQGLEMRQGEPTAGNQRAWARIRDGKYYSAKTPLIAAMRCFVASRMGDEVEIPEELNHAAAESSVSIERRRSGSNEPDQ